MRRPALLDVNILVALFNPDHIHHEPAHDWFADNRRHGWATCPLTELGLVRILANPAYWTGAERSAAVLERLRKFCASGQHSFWPDVVSLADDTLFDLSYASGHRQLTDVYLLGLTVRKKGSLATFDRSIPLRAVIGAKPDTLAVIAPAIAE
jgi:toxin-antitoxin system PIN domain toxin